MARRAFALICVCLTALTLSGCMAAAARSDPSQDDRFQPLIGTRSSITLIGDATRMAILRTDENGKRMSHADGAIYLGLSSFFAADLPATATMDLISLPFDVGQEVTKYRSGKSPQPVD